MATLIVLALYRLFWMSQRICSRETNSLLLVFSNYYVQIIVSTLLQKIGLCIHFPKFSMMTIDKNSEKIVSGGSDSTLSLIMAFLKRVDDVAAKSEATRILTNLVKSIWSECKHHRER